MRRHIGRNSTQAVLGSHGGESSAPSSLRGVGAYVCLVEVRLHQNDSHDLKGKRKLVQSLKSQLRQRFGASVAEIDGHDTWQRTTLLCALVGDAGVSSRADELQRFVESRCPAGCSFDRDLRTLGDIRG